MHCSQKWLNEAHKEKQMRWRREEMRHPWTSATQIKFFDIYKKAEGEKA